MMRILVSIFKGILILGIVKISLVCEKINLLRSNSTLPFLFIIVIFLIVNLVNPYIINLFIEFLNKSLCKLYLNEKTLKKIDISLVLCDTVINIL